MTLRISELFGVDPALADKLKDAGLDDSAKLLGAVAHPANRQDLSERLGIDERRLLELGNRADLARIKGIGAVYSDLLEFAGVDTVAELAGRNPDNLYAKIMEVASGHSVQRPPSAADVADWVAQAKALGRGIFY